jgi:hypothetical protein
MRLTRIIAAVIAAAFLTGPAAYAQPPDMHASVANAAAKAREKQDLRSPDARDAATVRLHKSGVAVNAPGATAVDSATIPAPDVAPAPAVKDSDDGVDWMTIGLGIAGTLLAVSAIALVSNRRSPQRLRTSV